MFRFVSDDGPERKVLSDASTGSHAGLPRSMCLQQCLVIDMLPWHALSLILPLLLLEHISVELRLKHLTSLPTCLKRRMRADEEQN